MDGEEADRMSIAKNRQKSDSQKQKNPAIETAGYE